MRGGGRGGEVGREGVIEKRREGSREGGGGEGREGSRAGREGGMRGGRGGRGER